MEQKRFKTKEQSVQNSRKWQRTFIVNSTLLVLGIVASISGLIIQCHYHLQKSPDDSVAFALNRQEWNAVHVWTSLFFLLVTIYHVWAHRRWYVNVFKRNLLAKHRPTVILTAITFLVILSGLIPLCILCFEANSILRFSIIEIHDKIAILFLIVVVRHTIIRFKWYVNRLRSKF